MTTSPLDRPAWSVPIAVDALPEDGRHIVLSADEQVRAAVAAAAGLVAVDRLDAQFDLQAFRRDGVKLTGLVEATVVQTCVVTLERVTNTVREEVDLVFAPEAEIQKALAEAEDEEVEPPETLVDGTIDLGALAVEFLVLGLDPYPRKPDVAFVAPTTDDGRTSPFAALAALKRSN